MYDMLKEEKECRLGNGFPEDDGWTIINAEKKSGNEWEKEVGEALTEAQSLSD